MYKFTLPIIFSFIAFSYANADTTSVYKINGTVRSLVAEYVDVPPMLQNANIKVTITAFPKQRYYKSEIKLLAPHDRLIGFTKTLEIWDAKSVVRTSVNVDIRLRIPFLRRIIERKIEEAILCGEQIFINKHLTKEK